LAHGGKGYYLLYVCVGVAGQDNVKEVGKSLFTTYLFPLEVASVILLTAMIGAILLGRKEE